MKVLGIDPGYDRLGLAVIEKTVDGREQVIFSTCLATSPTLDFGERLLFLINKIEQAIKKYRPDLLAIEKIFFASNHKTAIAVAEVRGAILYLAKKLKIPVLNLTPLEVKSAITGYGQADKTQVKFMVQKLLRLSQPIKQDDEADALAIALTGLSRAVISNYPQSVRATLAKKTRYAKK